MFRLYKPLSATYAKLLANLNYISISKKTTNRSREILKAIYRFLFQDHHQTFDNGLEIRTEILRLFPCLLLNVAAL